ncbi:hypothetical protein LTR50_004278 [Elasticomyces elasticus]|nr:hypothetical protein LTR50_004278 [Elasticomyces elasticus]
MQIAEILSDLTSLRVCKTLRSLSSTREIDTPDQDPAAALALVSARPPPTTTTTSDAEQRAETGQEATDADLRRAKELLELHSSVKLAHRGGVDRELEEARESVRRALGGVV